jgi:E-phenylitaconyl-CoA hydratase
MAIDVEVSGAVATVTINRPERLNALDAAHYEALGAAFIRVRDDPAIRCAIVTGAGAAAFCAGADIKDWLGREQPLAEIWQTQQRPLLTRGIDLWKPVIAAVNGACVGGGMTLLMATDIRVASRDAIFALPEGRRGIIPANGGTQRILRQLPHAVGMKMLLTGDSMSSAEAARWGLVNDVVEPDQVMAVAMDYARRIAAMAPLSTQAAKELALRSYDLTLDDGMRMEALAQRALMGSRDAAEGRAAFAERREPAFGGL